MLTDLQLYLFDSCGFVVVPGLFAEKVPLLRDELVPFLQDDEELVNTLSCRDLLVRSRCVVQLAQQAQLTERVRMLINQPIRLVEGYALSRAPQSKIPLHNGNAEVLVQLPGAPRRNLSQQHIYHDGRLYCMLVKALIYLDNIESNEDGPFCYVQGSHKANFALMPLLAGHSSRSRIVADREFPSLLTQTVRAGDLLLLNEALMHGTLTKYSSTPRRVIALSYAPAFVSDWKPLVSEDVVGPPGHYDAYEGEFWVEGPGR